MKLLFANTLKEMRPVLKNPGVASGSDPVYQVFTNLDVGNWSHMTAIVPGNYDGEFPKTFGHYHLDGFNETYRVAEGEAVLIAQRDTTVLLVKAKTGDEVSIPADFGHAWANVGKIPLILYDNHPNPKTDYESITQKHGLGYYLIEENGEVKAIPNPNYQSLLPPEWLTVEEFNRRGQKA